MDYIYQTFRSIIIPSECQGRYRIKFTCVGNFNVNTALGQPTGYHCTIGITSGTHMSNLHVGVFLDA